MNSLPLSHREAFLKLLPKFYYLEIDTRSRKSICSEPVNDRVEVFKKVQFPAELYNSEPWLTGVRAEVLY